MLFFVWLMEKRKQRLLFGSWMLLTSAANVWVFFRARTNKYFAYVIIIVKLFMLIITEKVLCVCEAVRVSSKCVFIIFYALLFVHSISRCDFFRFIFLYSSITLSFRCCVISAEPFFYYNQILFFPHFVFIFNRQFIEK